MAMGGGIFLWEQNETAVPSRSAVDPLFWRPKQRGIVDLTANVAILALLAAQAAIVTRSPLVVNRPTQARVQVEQSQNRSIYGQAIAAAPIVAPLDPAQYRRAPAQIDSFPNLAATAIAIQALPPVALQEPIQYRRAAPQLDIFKNIAVNLQTQVIWPTAEPQLTRRIAQTPDLAPNIAVNLQTQTAGTYIDPVSWRARFTQPPLPQNIAATSAPVQVLVVTQLPDTVSCRAKTGAPDLAPNLAVQFVEPPGLQRSLVEPTTGLRRFAFVDTYPNLAAFSVVAPFQPAPFVEPIFTKRAAPQIDVHRNLAATAAAQFLPPPFVEPQFTKRPAPQLDPYRNIAVSFQGQLVWPAADLQPARRAVSAPDLYPNLAAAALEPYSPPGMVEPQLAPRRAQPPELFTNVAARATPAAQVFLALPIEPTYSRRYWPQVPFYQNIAVQFTASLSFDVRGQLGVDRGITLLSRDRVATLGRDAYIAELGNDRTAVLGVDSPIVKLGAYG